MKKLLFIIIISILIGCGGSSGGSSNSADQVLTKLEIANNINFAEKSGNFAQITSGISTKAEGDENLSVEEITTEELEPITVENVIPINSQYSLLQNLTITGEDSSELDYILNVSTGELTLIDIFPDNKKKVAIKENLIYFSCKGALYELNVTNGNYVQIANSYYLAHNAEYTLMTGFPSDCYIFIDEQNRLFTYNITSSWGVYSQGVAEKYIKENGDWIRDITSDARGINTTYYDDFADTVKKSDTWIIQDENTLKFYHVKFETERIVLYNFDMSIVNKIGEPIYILGGFPSTNLTWLGYKKTIQQSFFTSGENGIKINSFLSKGSENIIAEAITAPQGLIIVCDDNLTVINQKYVEGKVFAKKNNGELQSWDISTSEVKDVENSSGTEFIN